MKDVYNDVVIRVKDICNDTVVRVKGVPFRLKFVFEFDPEDHVWVGYCLELNLVAVFPTYTGAQKDLLDVVYTQIEYAIENSNMEHLYRSAPQEIWDKYLKGVAECPIG